MLRFPLVALKDTVEARLEEQEVGVEQPQLGARALRRGTRAVEWSSLSGGTQIFTCVSVNKCLLGKCCV